MPRVYILLPLLALLCACTTAHAQNSGPLQPDIAGGGGGNGVDEFSGAYGFSLPVMSVPGPDGAGYTINLTYRSGAPFDAASWVGYGWSLGAEAVVRDKRGLPDDWVDTVRYWRKNHRNYTVTGSATFHAEVMSQDKVDTLIKPKEEGEGADTLTRLANKLYPQASFTLTGRYNNNTGYSISMGLDAGVKGIGGLTYTVRDDGSVAWYPYVSPTILLGSPEFTKANQDKPFFRLAPNFGALGGRLDLSHEFRPPGRAQTGFTGFSTNFSANFLLNINAFLSGLAAGEQGNVTMQENVHVTPLRGVGYMYSSLVSRSDLRSVMDYYVERDLPYRKDDPFLPAPFSNADNFVIAGGGGSFRLHQNVPGAFRPNQVTGSIAIDQTGFEAHGGTRFGIGADFGLGRNEYRLNAWETAEDSAGNGYRAHGDEARFFRANGDLGGNVLFAENDSAVAASLLGLTVNRPASLYGALNGGERSGRTAHIGYRTNKEMLEHSGTSAYYTSYNRDSVSRALVNRTDPALADQLGEIVTYDGAGNRYVYGLPVYSRNEKELVLGVESGDTATRPRVKSNLLVYRRVHEGTSSIVQGETRGAPYATAFLLTEVTSGDYVDVTGNGPSPDDIGGYTLFRYRRTAGSNGKSGTDTSGAWYRWRTPYNGLVYGANRLADPKDDVGQMSTGEREVYYLDAIETKTHIAQFVTNKTNTSRGGRDIDGSGEERKDGYEQIAMASDSLSALVAGDSTATAASGANHMEQLERIELYVKGTNGRPDSLQGMVHFEYDNSLRRGLPNSVSDGGDRAGLLTLKRVWFQSLNVVPAKIAPYTFGYAYKTSSDYASLPSDVLARYSSIISYGDQFSSGEQNPNYGIGDVDRWGAYRHNGLDRGRNMRPWVAQSQDTAFDPAAWQLKWVRTPSGGEVHVQYEQNDYAYVQDRPAMAMVSLLDSVPGTALTSADSYTDNRYYVRLSDLGVDATNYAEVAKAKALIQRTVIDAGKRMYFKMLYGLRGDAPVSLDSTVYRAEYIEGFANVYSVVIDTAAGGTYALRITLKSADGNGLPRKLCGEYVTRNMRGRLGPDEGIELSTSYFGKIGMIQQMVGTMWRANIDQDDCCKRIDYAHSYLRLPAVNPKLGGGIRVKRLLSYDPGINGDPMLYGTEYLYQAYDPLRGAYTSSGVATNEPTSGYDECPLYDVDVPEKADAFGTEVIGGLDMQKYANGPASSLLPGASVGYARVVQRSINSGKTNPGFSIGEYFTAKDYPFDKRYADLGKAVDHTPVYSHSFHPLLLALLPWAKLNEDRIWLSQGFRVIQNSMHGRQHRSSRYGGAYEDQDSWALAGMQEYTYYEPGEKLPLLDKVGDSLRMGYLGKEMEVASEGIAIDDNTYDATVEADASIFSLPPQISAWGSFNTNLTSYKAHVTTKVVRYPAVVKSTLTYGDGVYHYAENVAFDSCTGSPVIVRASDSYDRLALQQAPTGQKGIYHQYAIPACKIYPAMGQKAFNEGAVLRPDTVQSIAKSGTGGNYTLTLSPANGANDRRVAEGDLLKISFTADSSYTGVYTVKVKSGNVATLTAVPTTFAPASSDTGDVFVTVLRSGRTNQLGASAGAFSTYGETATDVATAATFTVVDSTRFGNAHVVAAGAQAFDNRADLYSGPAAWAARLWRPRSAYSYSDSATSGSRIGTSQRNYKDAGVLGGFSSYSWSVPASNDSMKWRPGGTVTKYDGDGVALEARDPLGVFSAVQRAYNNMLPVATAANAITEEIHFDSFEETGNDSTVAHAGSRSSRRVGNGSLTLGVVMVRYAPHDTGLMVRVWARFSNQDLRDDPTGRLSVKIGTTTIPLVKSAHEIAQTGEWTLYEVQRKGLSISADSAFVAVTFRADSIGSGDTIWVDDAALQPIDAEMTCSVYDPVNYRPVAAFGTDHFGVYTQYNAQGVPVRTRIETIRGMKTIADAYANVPRVDRVEEEGGGINIPGGDPEGSGSGGAPFGRAGASDITRKNDAPGGGFDLLNAEFGLGRRKVKVLGVDPDSLAAPNVSVPGLSIAHRARMLGELQALERTRKDLAARDTAGLSPADRERLRRDAAAVIARESTLLRRLGVSAEEARRLIEEARKADEARKAGEALDRRREEKGAESRPDRGNGE